MSRIEEMEINICTARTPDKEMREDTASSRTKHEETASGRLDEEGSAKDNANCRISSKLLSLSIQDQVGYKSKPIMNILTTPISVIRRSPISDRAIHHKCAKSIINGGRHPDRKPNSDELLSVERMDRLLKMRRRRKSSFDHNDSYWREHSCNSSDNPAGASNESSLLQKRFLQAANAEYKLPEALFVPLVGDGCLADTDPFFRSKFTLKPRLKRKAVFSHRSNRRK